MSLEKMPNRPGAERKSEWETCTACHGTGRKDNDRCPRCQGTGKLRPAAAR